MKNQYMRSLLGKGLLTLLLTGLVLSGLTFHVSAGIPPIKWRVDVLTEVE